MAQHYLFILMSFFVSCKNDLPKQIAISKPVIVVLDTAKNRNSIAIDTAQIHKYKSELLNSFYAAKDNKTFWLSAEQRKTLISILKKSDKEGLNPNDYEVKKLSEFQEKEKELSELEWITYDLTLTNSFQKYIAHLSNGKLNPREIYTDWDLKENQIDINETINSIQKSDSLIEKTELLKPNNIVYKELKKALEIIDDLPKDEFKIIETTKKKFIPKDSNAVLIPVKKRLIYWNDLSPKDSLTKIYDKETVEAVKLFQTRHGLASDGVIGISTITALNFSKTQRKQQIIANLERWKWFPRELGNHYIIVNIPDYHLNVVKNNDTILEKRIVVGTAKRKTPILTSTFSNIVLNPTWTVPPTILKEDLVPSASKNRNYFASRQIVIYDFNQNIINPLNWDPEKAAKYKYVQNSGYNNSLGTVKFNFPNRHSVYLHDTNHRDFFVKNYRSLSSGCVRVENPLPLAVYMLNDDKKWSLEKVNEVVKTKKLTSIALKEKINIHQFYWTAWSKKNKLIFRDDIYTLDADLYTKLGN